MKDQDFSPTSLIFFPFHTWIDAQYEIYIRRANQTKGKYSDYNKLKDYLYKKK